MTQSDQKKKSQLSTGWLVALTGVFVLLTVIIQLFDHEVATLVALLPTLAAFYFLGWIAVRQIRADREKKAAKQIAAES